MSSWWLAFPPCPKRCFLDPADWSCRRIRLGAPEIQMSMLRPVEPQPFSQGFDLLGMQLQWTKWLYSTAVRNKLLEVRIPWLYPLTPITPTAASRFFAVARFWRSTVWLYHHIQSLQHNSPNNRPQNAHIQYRAGGSKVVYLILSEGIRSSTF
jgi:hypothetical protein